eukprot:s2552_g13.t1
MAPERRRKRRRVASARADPGPSDDMPPPAPPASESSIPPPESSNPADSSIVHISGHVLPITDSPPRVPGDILATLRTLIPMTVISPLVPHPEKGPLLRLLRVGDHELISYKKDAKARPSWKTIGQRLHRSAESCRARWLWLQSTGQDQINVLAPRRAPEE